MPFACVFRHATEHPQPHDPPAPGADRALSHPRGRRPVGLCLLHDRSARARGLLLPPSVLQRRWRGHPRRRRNAPVEISARSGSRPAITGSRRVGCPRRRRLKAPPPSGRRTARNFCERTTDICCTTLLDVVRTQGAQHDRSHHELHHRSRQTKLPIRVFALPELPSALVCCFHGQYSDALQKIHDLCNQQLARRARTAQSLRGQDFRAPLAKSFDTVLGEHPRHSTISICLRSSFNKRFASALRLADERPSRLNAERSRNPFGSCTEQRTAPLPSARLEIVLRPCFDLIDHSTRPCSWNMASI